MKRAGTREKILAVSTDLFYFQGFENTGVQEIIDRCGITKPSLYYYYPTKAALGRAYLGVQEERFLASLRRSFERSASLEDFFRIWVGFLKRSARRRLFIGCPFTGFSSQTPRFKDTEFIKELQRIQQRSLQLLQEILARHAPQWSLQARQAASHEIMALHAGNTQLYRMTGDLAYLDFFAAQLLQISRRACPLKLKSRLKRGTHGTRRVQKSV